MKISRVFYVMFPTCFVPVWQLLGDYMYEVNFNVLKIVGTEYVNLVSKYVCMYVVRWCGHEMPKHVGNTM
jgi:hypothetical protein